MPLGIPGPHDDADRIEDASGFMEEKVDVAADGRLRQLGAQAPGRQQVDVEDLAGRRRCRRHVAAGAGVDDVDACANGAIGSSTSSRFVMSVRSEPRNDGGGGGGAEASCGSGYKLEKLAHDVVRLQADRAGIAADEGAAKNT